MHVFGTETHMTAVVGMALGKREIPRQLVLDSNTAADMFFKSADKVLTAQMDELTFLPFSFAVNSICTAITL